ncbi:MAG TPA: DUF484 domain-containing protein [Gammaproteobacteria bacterium]|nr:DUF484 domain-containing protein [Gammaproteobacteria bacterium]
MTTSQQTQTRELPLEEKTVADYLRDNPEFFHNNTSLLATLQIPHAVGPAVSLVEHQVKVLRDQNSQLKRKLMDLVHVARDNNRLNERMHQLTLGLINAHSLEALLDTLRENLLGEFKADTVTMRLAGMPEAQARECGVDILDPEAGEMVHFESFMKSSRPQCGRFKPEQLQYLFGDQSQAIESVALIPLGVKARLGLLAIGSREASRFHPGMGTLFLTHLGELTGLLLSDHIDADTPATD